MKIFIGLNLLFLFSLGFLSYSQYGSVQDTYLMSELFFINDIEQTGTYGVGANYPTANTKYSPIFKLVDTGISEDGSLVSVRTPFKIIHRAFFKSFHDSFYYFVEFYSCLVVLFFFTLSLFGGTKKGYYIALFSVIIIGLFINIRDLSSLLIVLSFYYILRQEKVSVLVGIIFGLAGIMLRNDFLIYFLPFGLVLIFQYRKYRLKFLGVLLLGIISIIFISIMNLRYHGGYMTFGSGLDNQTVIAQTTSSGSPATKVLNLVLPGRDIQAYLVNFLRAFDVSFFRLCVLIIGPFLGLVLFLNRKIGGGTLAIYLVVYLYVFYYYFGISGAVVQSYFRYLGPVIFINTIFLSYVVVSLLSQRVLWFIFMIIFTFSGVAQYEDFLDKKSNFDYYKINQVNFFSQIPEGSYVFSIDSYFHRLFYDTRYVFSHLNYENINGEWRKDIDSYLNKILQVSLGGEDSYIIGSKEYLIYSKNYLQRQGVMDVVQYNDFTFVPGKDN